MAQHPSSDRPPAAVPAADRMRRREALQALAGGIGAGVALPSVVSAQHPIHEHLSSPAAIERAQVGAAATPYVPVFFDAHQFATLDDLAESIVPGSNAARVAPFVDQLLAVASTEGQRQFVSALGAFDMAAIGRFGSAWIRLEAANKDALLRDASAGEPGSTPMRDHFQHLKDWISGAYYTSEPGMRELGWTGNVFFPALDGCTHPDGHAG